MKIAFASDDEQTISPHLGRAEKYIVYSVEQGKIIERKSLARDALCNSHHFETAIHAILDKTIINHTDQLH